MAVEPLFLQIERAKYNIMEGVLLHAYAKLELHWPIVMMTIIANLCMTESVRDDDALLDSALFHLALFDSVMLYLILLCLALLYLMLYFCQGGQIPMGGTNEPFPWLLNGRQVRPTSETG